MSGLSEAVQTGLRKNAGSPVQQQLWAMRAGVAGAIAAMSPIASAVSTRTRGRNDGRVDAADIIRSYITRCACGFVREVPGR
jgi:hypothetical protein